MKPLKQNVLHDVTTLMLFHTDSKYLLLLLAGGRAGVLKNKKTRIGSACVGSILKPFSNYLHILLFNVLRFQS